VRLSLVHSSGHFFRKGVNRVSKTGGLLQHPIAESALEHPGPGPSFSLSHEWLSLGFATALRMGR
jgi:hypothetical protein